MKKLKKLNLFNNCIKNINFLKNENSMIKELNLADNQIKDIKPLLKLEKLEIINIKDQQISINREEKEEISKIIEKIKTSAIICKENF